MTDKPITDEKARQEETTESEPLYDQHLPNIVADDTQDSDPLDHVFISPSHLQTYPERVVKYVQSLKIRYKRAESRYFQAQDKLENLNRELSQVRASYSALEIDYTDLNERMNKALSALADLKRDKSTGYVAELGPQNLILTQSFKSLGDQDLHHIVTEIYSRLSTFDQGVATKRKVIVTELKSILSAEIFIHGRSVFEAKKMSGEPATDVIVEKVVESIHKALGREIINSESSQLYEMLKDLVLKGEDVIDKNLRAESPGEFWVAQTGEEFDPERHEPILGCEATGCVTLTVFPGYSVGGRVFSKAQVRTSEH